MSIRGAQRSDLRDNEPKKTGVQCPGAKRGNVSTKTCHPHKWEGKNTTRGYYALHFSCQAFIVPS
jgi:hypothetical protein